MGGDHRGPKPGGGRQVSRVCEAADVIADHRPGGAGGGQDVGVPGVGRHRYVEAGHQRLDGGDDAVELLLLPDGRAGPGFHAADIEDVGAFGHQGLRPLEGEIEGEGGTLVVERVRRAVEDPHHETPAGEVVMAGPETQRVIAGGHGRGG